MIRIFTCAFVLLFCSSSEGLSAQTWMESRSAAIKALQSGSPSQAELALLSAWRKAAEDPAAIHPRAILAEDLAYLYLDQGKPAASLKFCNDAVDATRDNDPEKAAELLNSGGVILRTMGQFSEAEQMHNNALALLKSRGKEKTYAAAETYFSLGVLCAFRGTLAAAEKHFLKALAISAPFESEHQEGRARILDSTARLYTNWGKLNQAERYQKAAWNLANSMPSPDPKFLIDLLDSKGTLLFEKEKYAEAERTWKKARENASCPGCDMHIYAVLSHLGELYTRLGEYARAEDVVSETLQLAARIRAIPAADRALLSGEMGFIQCRLKRYDQARTLLIDSISELEKSGRPLELALMTAYYGEYFADQGYWEQAATQFERTAEIRRKYLGNHPLTITALLNCADAYKKLKRKADAKRYLAMAQGMTTECTACSTQGQTVDVRAFR